MYMYIIHVLYSYHGGARQASDPRTAALLSLLALISMYMYVCMYTSYTNHYRGYTMYMYMYPPSSPSPPPIVKFCPALSPIHML